MTTSYAITIHITKPLQLGSFWMTLGASHSWLIIIINESTHKCNRVYKHFTIRFTCSTTHTLKCMLEQEEQCSTLPIHWPKLTLHFQASSMIVVHNNGMVLNEMEKATCEVKGTNRLIIITEDAKLCNKIL